jgi:hypothetical protein
MLVRVVKNYTLTFLPIDHLITDPHTDIRPRLRYDQCKMTPEYTLVTPMMGLDVHSRRKDRKERNGIEQFARLRALFVAFVDPMAKDEEKI